MPQMIFMSESYIQVSFGRFVVVVDLYTNRITIDLGKKT